MNTCRLWLNNALQSVTAGSGERWGQRSAVHMVNIVEGLGLDYRCTHLLLQHTDWPLSAGRLNIHSQFTLEEKAVRE